MTAKPKHPWSRLSSEGMVAYELFLYYLSLGGERTPARVAADKGRRIELVEELKTKYKWVTRAKAYDDYLVDIQQKAIKRTLEQDAIKQAKRIIAQRETEYQNAQKLQTRFEEMMSAPIFRTEITRLERIATVEHPEGQDVAVAVTIEPVKWTLKDMLEVAKVSSSMARLSTGTEQKRETVQVSFGEGPADDPSMNLERARALLKHMQGRIDEFCARIPGLTPDKALLKLPGMVARSFKIDPDVLEAEMIEPELPGLSLEEVQAENEYVI